MWNNTELHRLLAQKHQEELLTEAQTQRLLSRLPRVGLRERLAMALEQLATKLYQLAERLEHHPGGLESPTHQH